MRSSTTSNPRRAAASLALAVVLGCQADLERGLDEEQANAILVALDRAGIGASKEPEAGGGDEPSFTIRVAPDDVAPGLAILRAEGLPRPPQAGLADTFGQGSLVPTATEERARLTAALSAELARTVESLDGVLDARVHIALPEPQRLGLGAPRPRPRASVMVRHRAEARRFDDDAVRRLVAGAVEDMDPENVAVVSIPAEPPPPAERQLARVGPFTVSRSSALGLKIALGALLATNLVLALVLALAWRQARRARREADEARAELTKLESQTK